MSKYKNIETTTSDGIRHASIKEANRWCELKMLERAGRIRELDRQVSFELIPRQTEAVLRYSKEGKRLKDGLKVVERSVVYKADFVYYDVASGCNVVEDTKGKKTKDYVIKRKLMLWRHGIRIKEI